MQHIHRKQLYMTLSSIGSIVQWKLGIMNTLWSFKQWTKWHYLSLIKTIYIHIFLFNQWKIMSYYINFFVIYVRHMFLHSARFGFISCLGIIFNVWYSLSATPHLSKDWISHTLDKRYFLLQHLTEELISLKLMIALFSEPYWFAWE